MDFSAFKNELEQLLEVRKKLHINDPAVYQHWNKIADFMASDEQNTIEFLKHCDQDTTEWISEIFEDISKRLRSKAFIKAIEKAESEFPELKLKDLVNDARAYL